jgi:hypothetical protein
MLNLKRGSGIGANGRYKSTWHVLVGFASILRYEELNSTYVLNS